MGDALAEEERAILRSELGKLMRIARPGAIYDAASAAQTFTDGGIVDFSKWGRINSEYGAEGNTQKEIIEFEHMPGYHDYLKKNQSNANKVNILGEIRRLAQ